MIVGGRGVYGREVDGRRGANGRERFGKEAESGGKGCDR